MKLSSITRVKNLKGKRVLLRTDYNVAVDGRGRVEKSELFRIERTLPTLQWLMKKRARVVILTHRGRPRGKDGALTLKPVAVALGKMLGKKIRKLDGIVGPAIKQRIDRLKPGQAVLLENLRFHKGEEKNSAAFARELASLGDIFINDAFATAHRNTASTVGIAALLPSYAGMLLQEEIASLSAHMLRAKKPLVIVMGGAKAKTKLPLLRKMLPGAQYILTGGILANTLLKAAGVRIGRSVYEPRTITEAKKLVRHKKVILPSDVICDNTRTPALESLLKDVDAIERDERIIDIGVMSVISYATILKNARTIFFNGPLGYMEKREGAHASEALAKYIAALTSGRKKVSVIGGGETVSVFEKYGLLSDVTFVSTGGGALLAFLADQKLPGIVPLMA